MKIEWLGHSCFKINDSLIIDPYKDGSVPGLKPLRTSADKVICTHEHADHSGRECVESTGNECSLSIDEIPCWHDDHQGQLRGPNTAFVVSDGTERLIHLGDLGHYPDDSMLELLKNADYLLVPVGGYYTIDAEMAAKICEDVNPKVIIPMHYRGDNFGYPELTTIDAFRNAIAKTTVADRVRYLNF